MSTNGDEQYVELTTLKYANGLKGSMKFHLDDLGALKENSSICTQSHESKNYYSATWKSKANQQEILESCEQQLKEWINNVQQIGDIEAITQWISSNPQENDDVVRLEVDLTADLSSAMQQGNSAVDEYSAKQIRDFIKAVGAREDKQNKAENDENSNNKNKAVKEKKIESKAKKINQEDIEIVKKKGDIELEKIVKILFLYILFLGDSVKVP